MALDVHVRELRYFLAVAEELHVTRAAARLFISQPALSKQLRALERRLGTTLFERDSRGVAALTEAGQALLEPARRALAELASADRALARVKASERSTVVVGISTGLGRGLLPAARSRFTAMHPGAELTVRQVGWGDPSCGLATGDTDVAYLWLPLPDPERYSWVEVATEPRLVALPADHPLATQQAVPLAVLFDQPFLALPASAGPLRDYWLVTDARAGRPPRIGAEVANLDETYEALVDGRGLCLLAAGNAALLERGGVVTRPVPGLGPSRLVLARRADDDRPLIHAYLRACRDSLPLPAT